MLDKKDIAVTLAKAHLDTVMTDYLIIGFDSRKEPIVLQEYFEAISQNNLTLLYEKFLERYEKINQQN